MTLSSTLVACSGRDVAPADTDGSTSSSTTTVSTSNDDDPSTTMPGTTVPGTSATGITSTGEVDSSSDEDDSDFSAGFYGGPPPDGGGSVIDCDVWAQDCPRGEKCMPWASDGGNSWNGLICSPLDPNPVQAGNACLVEGSGVSGIDNCALGAMCWNVDPDTNAGTCVDFCSGSEGNPICGDPSTSCVISNDGVLILCLQNCDPFAQDCPEGEGCYPVESNAFVCLPGEAPQGGHGESCEVVNACAPGFYCAEGTLVFGCESGACCTEVCDLDAQDPNAVCSEAANGETCTPLSKNPDFNVGACVLP